MIEITRHAFKRAKERLGWNKNTLIKMAEKVYSEGITHSQCKGALKKFITSVWAKCHTANNIKIHGEYVFLFRDNILITLYRVPNNLLRLIKKSK